MKTLFVTPFSPYPLVFGGAIRLYHLMRMFRAFSDVSLLSYESWAEDQLEVRAHLEDQFDRVTMVPKPAQTALGRARSVLSPQSFQFRSHQSRRFQHELDRVLTEGQFDCVVVEMTPMAAFDFSKASGLLVLDMQNIEHELVLRRAEVAGGRARRFALELEGRKLRREELAACHGFDLIFTPSARERDLIQAEVPERPVVEIPNAIDPEFFALRDERPTANELTFIGATHVDANRVGLNWFLNEVFPLIEAQVPAVHFTVIGGDPPPEIKAFDARPNIDVIGYVPDVRPYMTAASALVVPLLSGGGTRLKVLEGLSRGVPTVSTSIGAEGLGLVDGHDILLGDDAVSFARQVIAVLGDEALQQRLSVNGRRVAETTYSWRAVGDRVHEHLANAWVQRSVSA